MLDRSQGLPLGHDGYLKLWALSQPQAQADYIMVDEAQDLNPVLLEVLNRAQCQIVYVGDLYYALLLKDIGCSSNAARMAAAFAADDQVVKQHFKFIDREKLGKTKP